LGFHERGLCLLGFKKVGADDSRIMLDFNTVRLSFVAAFLNPSKPGSLSLATRDAKPLNFAEVNVKSFSWMAHMLKIITCILDSLRD
jgi:hypothetical protein